VMASPTDPAGPPQTWRVGSATLHRRARVDKIAQISVQTHAPTQNLWRGSTEGTGVLIKVLTQSTSDGGAIENVVLLGLSRGETELLLEGAHVSVYLPLVDPQLPDLVVTIMAGETKESTAAEVTGLLGRRVLPA
jgi:hypothetical protein